MQAMDIFLLPTKLPLLNSQGYLHKSVELLILKVEPFRSETIESLQFGIALVSFIAQITL